MKYNYSKDSPLGDGKHRVHLPQQHPVLLKPGDFFLNVRFLLSAETAIAEDVLIDETVKDGMGLPGRARIKSPMASRTMAD